MAIVDDLSAQGDKLDVALKNFMPVINSDPLQKTTLISTLGAINAAIADKKSNALDVVREKVGVIDTAIADQINPPKDIGEDKFSAAARDLRNQAAAAVLVKTHPEIKDLSAALGKVKEIVNRKDFSVDQLADLQKTLINPTLATLTGKPVEMAVAQTAPAPAPEAPKPAAPATTSEAPMAVEAVVPGGTKLGFDTPTDTTTFSVPNTVNTNADFLTPSAGTPSPAAKPNPSHLLEPTGAGIAPSAESDRRDDIKRIILEAAKASPAAEKTVDQQAKEYVGKLVAIKHDANETPDRKQDADSKLVKALRMYDGIVKDARNTSENRGSAKQNFDALVGAIRQAQEEEKRTNRHLSEGGQQDAFKDVSETLKKEFGIALQPVVVEKAVQEKGAEVHNGRFNKEGSPESQKNLEAQLKGPQQPRSKNYVNEPGVDVVTLDASGNVKTSSSTHHSHDEPKGHEKARKQGHGVLADIAHFFNPHDEKEDAKSGLNGKANGHTGHKPGGHAHR